MTSLSDPILAQFDSQLISSLISEYGIPAVIALFMSGAVVLLARAYYSEQATKQTEATTDNKVAKAYIDTVNRLEARYDKLEARYDVNNRDMGKLEGKIEVLHDLLQAEQTNSRELKTKVKKLTRIATAQHETIKKHKERIEQLENNERNLSKQLRKVTQERDALSNQLKKRSPIRKLSPKD